jgi:hypothetical protein
MKIEEHLSWILDYKKDTYSYEEDVPDKCISKSEWVERNWNKHEETVKKNIEYVNSLGLKCDSVGWCSLDLNRPDIDSLLEQINSFVLKEGLYLRGNYGIRCLDFDSEWYLLESDYLSNGEWNYVDVTDRNGNPLKIDEVYAYKIPKFTQVLWENKLPHVTEDIRNCCLNHGFSGVGFYWIRDIGRYDATQFFGLIIENIVPEFACDRYLSYCDSKDKGLEINDHSIGSPLYQKYIALGGTLPKLSQMFYDLRVNLPIQLPKNKMPETDFACTYFNRGGYSKHYALIKKHAAEVLLSEKAIRKEYLTPVILYDSEPEGYYIQTSETIPYPSEEVIKKLELDYDKLKNNPKPERKASEKDALNLFREIKRLRPEDFKKGLAKKKLVTLAATTYELLSSYYSISDGGFLSDEYNFLAYSESLKETQVYAVETEKEELHVDRYKGLIFAKCADGDTVMACNDGSVKRISHESMDVCESWDTVAQFFSEALTYT